MTTVHLLTTVDGCGHTRVRAFDDAELLVDELAELLLDPDSGIGESLACAMAADALCGEPIEVRFSVHRVTHVELETRAPPAPLSPMPVACPPRCPQGLPVPLALGQMEDLARRTRDLSSVLEGILREERARRGGHDPEA